MQDNCESDVDCWNNCIFLHTGKCNKYSGRTGAKGYDIQTFSTLNADVKAHMSSLQIPYDSQLNEAMLVLNRAGLCTNDVSDDMQVCPYHRFSLGVKWKPSQRCQHPLHSGRQSTSIRHAHLQLAATVDRIGKVGPNFFFPIGQSFCRDCRAAVYLNGDHLDGIERTLEDEQHDDYALPHESDDEDVNMSCLETTRKDANAILKQLSEDISPLTYQVRVPVHSLSKETLRKLERKCKQITEGATKFACESIAPGQGKDLQALICSEEQNLRNTALELTGEVSSLLEAFQTATNKKMQIFILSLLPSSLSKNKVRSIFGCSKWMIDKGRQFKVSFEAGEYLEEPPKKRQRVSSEKITIFVEFLFRSGLIQDVAYGTTKLKLNSSHESILIPHAVRTTLKTHIFRLYQKNCEDIGEEPLGRTLAMEILDACKTSERKSLSGIDSFAAKGNEAIVFLEDTGKPVPGF